MDQINKKPKTIKCNNCGEPVRESLAIDEVNDEGDVTGNKICIRCLTHQNQNKPSLLSLDFTKN